MCVASFLVGFQTRQPPRRAVAMFKPADNNTNSHKTK